MIWFRALLFVLAVQVTVIGVIPLYLAGSGPHIPPGPWAAIGLLPLTVGVLALIWCNWAFVAYGRGTAAPYNPPRVLVAHGLYRYVRNPMYVAAVLVDVGLALWTGSLVVLLYVVVLAVMYNAFVRGYEEPNLRRNFGESYAEYVAAVPRWIPRLRPWPGPQINGVRLN
jgi:protein-S-isoprenylcysteine O-methyltransferase Ste14